MNYSYLTEEKLNHMTAKWGELHAEYILRAEETINKARREYSRLLAIRIDLRFPLKSADAIKMDREVITRTIKSLNKKICADSKRKKKRGLQVYPCRVRFIWVREFKQSDNSKKHYHVLLLLNKDAYYHPGDFSKKNTLSYMIKSAWASAIGISYEDAEGLVEFPANGCYWIKRNGEDELKTFDAVMFRTSYFAKMATKVYGDGERNFGCSQG
ncbi:MULTISPECIES: inovirus Gp2 family protein [Enterobacterales]|uniref:inovirus Gp2 family protein n=1 Tax=Enterobacterales TaxID=91347 RepID=UPI002ED9BA16